MDVELLLDAKALVAEGPTWDDLSNTLVWVDIRGHRLHRLDPASGVDAAFDTGQPVSAVALCADSDTLILALRDGFGLLEAGQLSLVAPVETRVRSNRMNEGKVDPGGYFWAGTMDQDGAAHAGALYRLSPEYAVTKVLGNLTIPNGMDWTDDAASMYFIDSGTGRVDIFDYDCDTAAIGNRRPVVEIDRGDGQPDGMTLDADGYLWVAIWGGSQVRRYAPSGRLDGVVELPCSLVTSCCFGGRDLKDLYITTSWARLSDEEHTKQPHAGGLYRCRPGVSGRHSRRFRRRTTGTAIATGTASE
jgi:sugar lactone lactonase YvrE